MARAINRQSDWKEQLIQTCLGAAGQNSHPISQSQPLDRLASPEASPLIKAGRLYDKSSYMIVEAGMRTPPC